MSPAASAPEPDDRGTPPDRGGLSAREDRILEEIAGYENGADPSFAARLTRPRRPLSPGAERMLQVAIVLGVLAVVLPTAWVMVGVVVLTLVVVPTLLAWQERAQARRERAESDGPEGPDGPPPT